MEKGSCGAVEREIIGFNEKGLKKLFFDWILGEDLVGLSKYNI